MYYPACGVLLAAGLALNLKGRRMLALTVLVGASIFLPVPRETAEQFYSFCIVAELAIGVCALALRNGAGVCISELCALLVVAHLMGYALDGAPAFSPYRYIVKLLEVSQLLVCVALSPKLAPILRNRYATTS